MNEQDKKVLTEARDRIKKGLLMIESVIGSEASETVFKSQFTGKPTEYFGRAMPEAEAAIQKWKNSDNEYMAKGAQDVDANMEYFVFFENEAQFEQLSPEAQKVIRKNSNKYFKLASKRNQLYPLVDLSNRVVPGHFIFCFGSHELPSTPNRDEVIRKNMDVESSVQYWVESESQKYKPRRLND